MEYGITLASVTAENPRLYGLRYHAKQVQYASSPHRFNVVPAGRRSGKTERAKRRLRRRALRRLGVTHRDTARYFAAAPTRDQAKRIFWDDLKRMFAGYMWRKPSESELILYVLGDVEVQVLGMDKPERIEGSPWDGGILDEYANMKAHAWGAHVRPALADRNGWCDLTGVPEGRNHYYETYQRAVADMMTMGADSEWGAYTWFSSDILPAKEIAAAKRDLDPMIFAQEYEASFISFLGRAYYNFGDGHKLACRQLYDPRQPLIFCFDFNVSPGVAVVCQELHLKTLGRTVTCVIGEVWVDDFSNTEIVCRKLCKDWVGVHQGIVQVYGDATGGSRGTAKTTGSDWDIVKRILRYGDAGHDVRGFGERVSYHVPSANPSERARVNAVNQRLRKGNGDLALFVDPKHASHVVIDLEGVQTVAGGSGEIDKKRDPKRTHISDALGYYVVAKFPVVQTGTSFQTLKPFSS
jgi:hypothetical protein